MAVIQRAIISVSDKAGLIEFCQVLKKFNVEILSTGGTSKHLKAAGIDVVDVSDFTQSPEILDGRVKTLHPKIEGGILGIRANVNHQKQMAENGIKPIDMVIVNLYPFEQTIAKPDCTFEEAIENIDIGGPTMIRAASKNYQDVTTVVDPLDYQSIAKELQESGGSVSAETNFKLAVKVFEHTARYDAMIAAHLQKSLKDQENLSKNVSLAFEKIQDLRYGENPHQKAAVYKDAGASKGIIRAQQLQGKELSFNNFIDLEAAYLLACEFDDPVSVIIKHTNPCGVGIGKTIEEAFIRSREADPVSSFGGIIGLNRVVDAATAKQIGETFFECIIAPSYEPAALDILKAKKNMRLMVLNPWKDAKPTEWDLKRLSGGLLIQERDLGVVDIKACQVASKRVPTETEYAELAFAWKICKHVKSNAIVFTKNSQSLGVGAGQMSRVDSVTIAIEKSRQDLKGAVIASDAFFPFRDGLDLAAKKGITAVIQPGGSVRDEEVIAAANEHNLAMVFTGMRHFKH